jgi:hypothetical protein
MRIMDVELLVIPDCPNAGAAAALLRAALDDIGLRSTSFTTTVVATELEAAERGFTGSPTFLLNGTDPFAERRCPPALACRVYPHPAGPAGVPALSALRQALKRAAASAA